MESLYGVAIVPLIIAAIALLKGIIPEPAHKYMGLVAWALGIAIAFAYGVQEGWEPLQCVVVGSAVGLSAAGLYSAQKNAREV
ncbi:hypothetical protein BR63_00035 [Thermanaerosceptrum fracticalcis]|uniref:Holin n=1 Tax=Thermanaerosceptrum fracticalcis TaxID=1712410 RepID=A0A7G6DYF5_THEFR|nr:hypothetical protein [Thermanaerosceptrum fracticalcis]QNB44859.1 hypothetical protein BR63_00035 [Thermanaerosceptrum fracticalcis]